MKKVFGSLVLALMLLTSAALAADLDTPRIGAAVCMPEEETGSVVLHEAPDGQSETLMRYFQGAPLQVLDLADGWAHVRMGMTGKSLEGYIRQERLKYGAEAMREVQQHAEMPAFDEDTPVYEACDKQSGVIDTLAAPGAVKIMVDYEGGSPVAVTFGIETAAGPRGFRLPAAVDGTLRVFARQKIKADREQAKRTAWRNVRDWVLAQIALVESCDAAMDEVFLPYLADREGRTLYQLYSSG